MVKLVTLVNIFSCVKLSLQIFGKLFLLTKREALYSIPMVFEILFLNEIYFPKDTGRKLNVHKTLNIPSVKLVFLKEFKIWITSCKILYKACYILFFPTV